MFDLIVAGGLVAFAAVTTPLWKRALDGWLQIKIAERLAKAQTGIEAQSIANARDAALLADVPEQMRRLDELEELKHREAVARQTARVTVAEANVEILKLKTAKMIESGDVDKLLSLPPPVPMDAARGPIEFMDGLGPGVMLQMPSMRATEARVDLSKAIDARSRGPARPAPRYLDAALEAYHNTSKGVHPEDMP